jgi:hypothetical protein
MKRLFIMVLCGLLITACVRKPMEEEGFNNGDVSMMRVEVKTKENPDCHVPEIIFLNGQQKAFAILGDNRGTYLATGLPDSADVGDQYNVEIVKPLPNNALNCSSMGPAWAQVHIIQIW